MPLVPSLRALRLVAAERGLGTSGSLAEVRSMAGLRLDVHGAERTDRATVVCLLDGPTLGRAPAALAAIGLRALGVHLPPGAAPTDAELARLLHDLAVDPHLAPTGRVAVLVGTSRLGLALRAAAHDAVAPRIAGVLAVGAPDEAEARFDDVVGLLAPVTLLLGTDATAAVARLEAALTASRVPCRVCRTRLLDRAGLTLRAAADVPELLDAVAQWLDDVDGAVRVARAA